jgi:hypothetical protein
VKPPNEPRPDEDQMPSKASRSEESWSEEAHNVIAQYANDLREIVKKLLKKLN